MELKELLLAELSKNGYADASGNKVWSVANRSLIYITPAQVRGFMNIRKHPRYKSTVTEIEMELIKKNSEKFIQMCGEKSFNLIDMGCGDGSKAKVFLTSIKDNKKVRYCPVSPNKNLVELSLKNIKKVRFSNVKDYGPYVSTFDSLDEVAGLMRNKKYQKNIILLFGSILASFEIHNYLFDLSRVMFRGDCLIIGNAIREGERLAHLENYKHPLFNQWLIHTMKELGFKENEIKYNARFANSRVECYYKVNVNKKIKHKGKTIEINRGDEVIVAILYKYFDNELREICKRYFSEVDLEKDKENEYALIFCTK